MKTKLYSLVKVAISNRKILAAGLAASGLTGGIGYISGKDKSEKKDRAMTGFALGAVGTGAALVGNNAKNEYNNLKKVFENINSGGPKTNKFKQLEEINPR